MGAHIARLARKPTWTSLLALVFLLLLSFAVMSFGASDSEILLRFKDLLSNTDALNNWNPSVTPCNGNRANWIGVICMNGTVWGLQLENMGLTGNIDVDSLLELPWFRTISLMNNNFMGPIPDIGRLGKLKSLYLSNNQISGSIPDDAFKHMYSLKKIYLANNLFTGKIPSSLTEVPRLLELRLDGNQFEGRIPEFDQEDLILVNVANNELEGPIPTSLSKMPSTSFTGNYDLCGPPLQPCTGRKKPSVLNLVLIVAIVVLVVSAIDALFFFLYWKKKHASRSRWDSSIEGSSKFAASTRGQQEEPRQTESIAGQSRRGRTDPSKLIFLRDDIEKFDLQDLLRASAEVLGSGTFGSSYKAVIMSGQALVVKRYKHMNQVGREEFHEHMRRLGRLRHQNLLPLAAYYYRKEEKLLISEFVENGSLAKYLHGNRSQNEQGLSWLTRLKIIKGVAQGLAYLYNELPTIVPHGHLKSSNVLLDDNFEPLLTDYSLRPVVNAEHAHTIMIAYKSPDYTQLGHATKKTDIWCLGTLILEILTGKFPENYVTTGYDTGADLATWVNTMVKEKRTGEVFDAEMTGTKDRKQEMINLLKIGLSCCEENEESRLEMKEVIEQIEHLEDGSSTVDDSWNVSRGTEGEYTFSR